MRGPLFAPTSAVKPHSLTVNPLRPAYWIILPESDLHAAKDLQGYFNAMNPLNRGIWFKFSNL